MEKQLMVKSKSIFVLVLYFIKWTLSQGQFTSKLRCAFFMLPFGQLPLPNIPQQVFSLRTTDGGVQSCKT